ncbi:MAG: PorT family protein [Bacteroidales bacterium]|jgi:hypothetical protein|nr:PorT family protein [Bacteroidales bacterium]
MLKRNIILSVLIVVAGSIHAQVRPGIKLGYNLSGVAASYTGTSELKSTAAGDPDNFHMKSGFQAGMVIDCPVNDAWAIQPGIRFTNQGFTDKYTGNGKSVKKFALYSLQIPVYAQYRLNIAEETNLLFQAGPYVGFGLFGRQKYTRKGKSVDLNDKQKKITFGGGTSNDIHKAFDYGVGAGVGIEFYSFQLTVAYDLGLYDASFKKDDTKSGLYNVDLRNHNLSITLAFIFGRRDPLQNKKD